MKNWKLLLIVSCFLLYLGIVFRPLLLIGKLPIPADLIVGMYHPWRDFFISIYPNGIPFKNFLISDPVRQLYPWRELAISLLKSGQLPGWNPYSFSGYPLAANFQSAPFYPLNILYLLGNFASIWSIQVILQLVLGFSFMCAFLKRGLKLSVLPCVFGSISWIGSGFFVAWLEWNSVIQTIIWLPLILLAIKEIFQVSKLNKWVFILGFSLISNLLAGHLQSAFYVWIVAGVYSFWLTYETKNFRPLFITLLTFIISVTLISWWLVPTIQLIFNSARSADQAIWQKPDWFIPWQNTAQFVAPDFFGNPATQNYFGVWNYAEFVGYIGIIPLLLAIHGLLSLARKNKFFVGLLVFSILFAFPTFIGAIPFQLNLPFISTAQPSRIIAIIDFCLVIFAALGLEALIKNKKSKKILVSILFLGVIIGALWIEAYTHHLTVSLRNLVIPTGLFILGSGLVLIRKFGLYLILLITVIDLSLFAQKFLAFSPGNWLYPQTKVLNYLEEQSKMDIFRIASVDDIIMTPNFSTYYRLQFISGYDPLYLERYAELTKAYERKRPDISPPWGYNRAIAPKDFDSPLFKLLNVKYLLSIEYLPWQKYDLVLEEGFTKIYRDKNPYPRAFLVSSTTTGTSKQDTINKMFQPEFDPLRTAIVEEKTISVETGGQAVISKYSENEVIIKTQSVGKSFLVLLDIYYPNWHVTVDGKKATIYITDYTFRGVEIPAGEHEVKFDYSLL